MSLMMMMLLPQHWEKDSCSCTHVGHCGTPCCMLECGQSGSVRNTVLQSDGHMLTSTWCSSYYTRKCWKMCRWTLTNSGHRLQDTPLGDCGQVRGCSHFFGQISCIYIRNVRVFFPLLSLYQNTENEDKSYCEKSAMKENWWRVN